MRFNSQRGVSLLLLIIAITVFAGVAIGIVTLLRARYESYPYQVQSYQAYALANAGVEFAIRYAKDNNTDPTAPTSFSLQPQLYIHTDGTYKTFTSGNLKFSLKYVPGCPDMLYSKATYGTATREVILSNFGSYLGAQGASVYIVSSQVTRSCYGAGCAGRTCYNGTSSYSCPADPYPGPYSGDRIQITYCNPYTANANNYTMMIESSIYPPMGIVAATKPVTLGRIGFSDNSAGLPVANGVPTPQLGSPLNVWWAWDATCGITGPAVEGIYSPYCPSKFTQGGSHCWLLPTDATFTVPNPVYWPYLVDCVVSNDGHGHSNGYFIFPTVGAPTVPAQAPLTGMGVWDGTSDPPNAGYPFTWNSDTTTSSSTQYDASCRPATPCDASVDPTCDPSGPNPLNQCANEITDNFCPSQTWPPVNPVATFGYYSCFDTDQSSCDMGHGAKTQRSRATCHFPVGSWPDGVPSPISSYQLSVNANRLTIETIGHLDAAVPVKMYLSFYSWVSVGGNRGLSNAALPPVKNTFIFTVH